MHLPKSKTGIKGLDAITGGGLPTGRSTLICGGPGCGKSLMSMAFLTHGAIHCDESGVFVAFEESQEDLAQNVRSFGIDLPDLVARDRLAIDFVRVDPAGFQTSGSYDLEGLFIRLGEVIDRIGAKRIVFDTVETLFAGIPNPAILRTELRRLFRWLKEKQVTAVITGERGSVPGTLTREGLEEYVSDCVIVLDQRINQGVSTRRLRVVKYRGTTHGTDEYPLLIDADGFTVFSPTSLGLQYQVSKERVSSGVPGLDAMLEGDGYFRGSSILVSGTAGTGKSSLAAHFANASCGRGERILYFAFEESGSQILRNASSIGIDMAPWVEQDLLRFHCARPGSCGLEMHLSRMLKEIREFAPHAVVMDPLNSFVKRGNQEDVKQMHLHLIDALKMGQVTGFFTSLSAGSDALETTDIAISSLIDTWLLVRDLENSGERNRGLYILKSRGMAHSNQIREFSLTRQGIELREPYIGPAGVLTGSARLAQEVQERAVLLRSNQHIQRKQDELLRKREALEARISALRADFAAQEGAELMVIEEAMASEQLLEEDRHEMAHSRMAPTP